MERIASESFGCTSMSGADIDVQDKAANTCLRFSSLHGFALAADRDPFSHKFSPIAIFFRETRKFIPKMSSFSMGNGNFHRRNGIIRTPVTAVARKENFFVDVIGRIIDSCKLCPCPFDSFRNLVSFKQWPKPFGSTSKILS